MSTFICPVIRLRKIGKNPNADKLAIINGPQGPIQFVSGDFKEDDLAVFIPSESMVDVTLPEFAWLNDKAKNGKYRVKPVKLRGLPSVGLLIKAPPGLSEGDNAAMFYGIEKYVEPQTHSFRTDSLAETPPKTDGAIPVYDVENPWVLDEGVVVHRSGEQVSGPDGALYGSPGGVKGFHGCWNFTEKIHGCNMKIMKDEDGLHIGSRSRWVKDGDNPWWNGYRKQKERLDKLLDANPGIVFFGEVFGYVQDLHYGLKNNEVDVRLFDAMDIQTGFWPISKLGTKLFNSNALELMVPFLGQFIGRFEDAINAAKDIANGHMSTLDQTTIREGVVVRPVGAEFLVMGKTVARLMTKVINIDYLARHGGTEHQ